MIESKNIFTNDESIPIFRMKPTNHSNKCKIKYMGFITDSSKLSDENVNFDKPVHLDHERVGKNAIPIDNIGSYNMIGGLYICNIVGSHIIYSSRYPFMYLNIDYERPMVSGSLFQIFYSIEIDSNEKKNIKDKSKYVNLEFNGKWIRHIDCDDELKQNYDKYLYETLENEAKKLFYESKDDQYIKLRNKIKDNDISKWIDKYISSERVFYDSIMNDQPINFKSIHGARDEFVQFATSDKFHIFLKIAMKAREMNRRKEYGIEDMAYNVPSIYTKMDDIQNRMIDNDELVYD